MQVREEAPMKSEIFINNFRFVSEMNNCFVFFLFFISEMNNCFSISEIGPPPIQAKNPPFMAPLIVDCIPTIELNFLLVVPTLHVSS